MFTENEIRTLVAFAEHALDATHALSIETLERVHDRQKLHHALVVIVGIIAGRCERVASGYAVGWGEPMTDLFERVKARVVSRTENETTLDAVKDLLMSE